MSFRYPAFRGRLPSTPFRPPECSPRRLLLLSSVTLTRDPFIHSELRSDIFCLECKRNDYQDYPAPNYPAERIGNNLNKSDLFLREKQRERDGLSGARRAAAAPSRAH